MDVVKWVLSQNEAHATENEYGDTRDNECRACNHSKERPANDSWQ